MNKSQVPKDVSHAVRVAFTHHRKVCGCTHWAPFAQRFHSLIEKDGPDGANDFLAQARREAAEFFPAVLEAEPA